MSEIMKQQQFWLTGFLLGPETHLSFLKQGRVCWYSELLGVGNVFWTGTFVSGFCEFTVFKMKKSASRLVLCLLQSPIKVEIIEILMCLLCLYLRD